MTSYTTPHNLPLINPATDPIKDGAEVSSLAADINAVAQAANTAVATEGARAETAGKDAAIADATSKYGGLPARMNSAESKNTAQDARLDSVESVNTGQADWLNTINNTTIPQAADAAKTAAINDATTKYGELPGKMATALYYSRALATGEDLDTVKAPAIYAAPSTPVATSLLNIPEKVPGILVVSGPASGVRTQSFYPNTGGAYTRSLSTATNKFGPWLQLGDRGKTLPDGTDVNQFRDIGLHRIASTASAQTMLNLPGEPAPGVLHYLSTNGDAGVVRLYYGTGVAAGVWYSAMDVAASLPDNYVWSPWLPLHGEAAGGSDAGAAHVVQKKKARVGRGGPIGTAGKAVAAIRVDHNNTKFQQIMLPLLRERAIPATMCHFVDEFNPQPGYTGDTSTGYGWADVKAAALVDGIEVASHGWSHTDADLDHEITDARHEIEAQAGVKVPTFLVPGVQGTKWGGFSDHLDDPEVYSSTKAGRLIMANHAACDGYGSALWPLGSGETLGFPTVAVDSHTTSSSMIATFKRAQLTGSGAVMMIHPNIIDFGAGYITTAVLTEILDWMAAERDAGRLEILTITGMLHADPERSTRHNLVRDSAFSEGLANWAGTTGYTAAGDVASGSTSAGLLVQNITLADTSWAAGYSRMLTAQFRAAAGAVVKVRVSDSDNAANWDTSREVALPASGEWVTVRQPTTIPTTGTATIRVEAGRISGGAIDVRNIGLEAV